MTANLAALRSPRPQAGHVLGIVEDLQQGGKARGEELKVLAEDVAQVREMLANPPAEAEVDGLHDLAVRAALVEIEKSLTHLAGHLGTALIENQLQNLAAALGGAR